MNRLLRLCFPAVMLGFALALAHAEDGAIYKSTDKEGNVTYSSTPPATKPAQPVEVITPAPPPDPEEVRAAEAEHKRMEELGDKLEKERKAREAEQAARETARQPQVIERPVYVPVPVAPGLPPTRSRPDVPPPPHKPKPRPQPAP